MKIEGDYDQEDWYAEVRVNGKILTPERSLKVYRHSPDGFAWGYAGSGPSQLALAILLEAGLTNERAISLHQEFKRDFLQNLPRDSFNIDVDVDGWVRGLTSARIATDNNRSQTDGL